MTDIHSTPKDEPTPQQTDGSLSLVSLRQVPLEQFPKTAALYERYCAAHPPSNASARTALTTVKRALAGVLAEQGMSDEVFADRLSSKRFKEIAERFYQQRISRDGLAGAAYVIKLSCDGQEFLRWLLSSPNMDSARTTAILARFRRHAFQLPIYRFALQRIAAAGRIHDLGAETDRLQMAGLRIASELGLRINFEAERSVWKRREFALNNTCGGTTLTEQLVSNPDRCLEALKQSLQVQSRGDRSLMGPLGTMKRFYEALAHAKLVQTPSDFRRSKTVARGAASSQRMPSPAKSPPAPQAREARPSLAVFSPAPIEKLFIERSPLAHPPLGECPSPTRVRDTFRLLHQAWRELTGEHTLMEPQGRMADAPPNTFTGTLLRDPSRLFRVAYRSCVTWNLEHTSAVLESFDHTLRWFYSWAREKRFSTITEADLCSLRARAVLIEPFAAHFVEAASAAATAHTPFYPEARRRVLEGFQFFVIAEFTKSTWATARPTSLPDALYSNDQVATTIFGDFHALLDRYLTTKSEVLSSDILRAHLEHVDAFVRWAKSSGHIAELPSCLASHRTRLSPNGRPGGREERGRAGNPSPNRTKGRSAQ